MVRDIIRIHKGNVSVVSAIHHPVQDEKLLIGEDNLRARVQVINNSFGVTNMNTATTKNKK